MKKIEKTIYYYISVMLIALFALFFIFIRTDSYMMRKFSLSDGVKEANKPIVDNNSGNSNGDSDDEGNDDNKLPDLKNKKDYKYYYNDGDVRIAIKEVEDVTNDQRYYVADVCLTSVEYFKSLFAYGEYSSSARQGTKAMAKSAGAIFAINGDYYNQRRSGVIIRNGELYRNTDSGRDMLLMYENGDFEAVYGKENPDGNELIKKGIINTYVFGPVIVDNGKAVENISTYDNYVLSEHPRMMMGQVDTLHYVFVAVDGRDEDADGMDIKECATLMEKLGCKIAYNLDGGGSATMVFDGKIVNVPSQGSERSISDAIGIIPGGK